ncbi:diguanylate cyclase domain-containing protein [Castellaniella sp.]|uniref:diguanylate cyclase domain-containing protein n=1 Tax=Castellaniella sp. TaxID=1955812 RepID=UPI002AFF76CA|nr:diguanylate cyclase [Castellaniella sp.]
MLFDIVHISGITLYFVFVILFWWMSRVPRTNPGAGWWACALLGAALARLLLFALDGAAAPRAATLSYATFIALEKTLLVLGVIRFLKLGIGDRRVLWPAGLLAAWTGVAWLSAIPLWAYGIGLAAFNTAALAFIAACCLIRRREAPGRLIHVTALASGALALHWTTFPLVFFFPGWGIAGFAIGTSLALVQYLSLLANVLLQFQHRLLDAEERALELAYLDPLTGLNNQNYLNKLFEQALLLATRPHHFVAVFYIDLDNFKPINDGAGHRTGDEVLKEVARRLKESTRSTDINARIGGDEFIVVATQLERESQIDRIARKLLDRLTAEIRIDGTAYSLGASIGVSLYPAHGSTLPALIEAADKAMYRVKYNGKNGYALHGRSTPRDAARAAETGSEAVR